MFRKLFQSAPDVDDLNQDDDSLAALAHNVRKNGRQPENQPKTPQQGLGRFESFDEIYRNGPASQTTLPYDIMKVSKMLDSPHLSSMSVESKRGSLMMALEAAGAEPKDILQDAMVRQRALSDYEEIQQRKLRDYETFKGEENRQVQEELDQINAEYLARIQANVDEVAKQQDHLRAWQKSKQHELAVIAETCGYLAPLEGAGNNLVAALDRAARR